MGRKVTKVVLITGDELRHRYAAKILADSFDVRGIVAESKIDLTSYEPKDDTEGTKIVRQHVSEREFVEKRLLGDNQKFPDGIDLLTLEHGGSNEPEVFDWVKTWNPEIVVLYGSSIIKPPLLSHYDGRMINIHLGLSPYYRGSGTNFWPLVDGLPECVGVTIHLATMKVDGGDILTQARPDDIEAEDRVHEFGTKTIVTGLRKLCEVVPVYLAAAITPVKQDRHSGKLCRRKDFTHEAVTKMTGNFDSGMVREYLAHKVQREDRYPIIQRSQ